MLLPGGRFQLRGKLPSLAVRPWSSAADRAGGAGLSARRPRVKVKGPTCDLPLAGETELAPPMATASSLALPVRRMISAVTQPAPVRRMMLARQTCFWERLRSATIASRRARSEAVNRENQAQFRCIECGHEAHADVNAAVNILQAGTRPSERAKVRCRESRIAA